jgi:hypothetical protein
MANRALKALGAYGKRMESMRDKRIGGWVVLLLLWCIGSISVVQGADSDPFEAAQLERFPRAVPVPEVSLPDLEGKKIFLRSFKGQVVLINFWTTW